MKSIDCRGLNCPEPVLRTKNALIENPDADLNVVVDNETARENVMRFARNKGKETEWQQKDDFFHIAIKGSIRSETDVEQLSEVKSSENRPVLLITSNQMGQGSSELGEMLMRNFIYTLTKRDDLPQAIVFMNAGVKLTIMNSPAIDELRELENSGVLILVCGTCLDYYELKEQHQAGEVSNMYDIADLLFAVSRVISI